MSPSVRDLPRIATFHDAWNLIPSGVIGYKLANNTWIEQHEHDVILIRFHRSYIVRIDTKDQIRISTCGQRSTTVKHRLNALIANLRIRVHRGDWYAEWHGRNWLFMDGMILRPDGTVTYLKA